MMIATRMPAAIVTGVSSVPGAGPFAGPFEDDEGGSRTGGSDAAATTLA